VFSPLVEETFLCLERISAEEARACITGRDIRS
jgi:hypothetical protein